MRRLFVLLVVLCAGSVAFGRLVFVDADPYAPGTDISNVFPAVKLTTYYDAGAVLGKVFSRRASEPALASTGSNIFGHGVTGTDAHGRPRNESWIFPHVMLTVELYDPADMVSLDIIGDNAGDIAAVDVYNAALELIDSGITPELDYGQIARIEIKRDSYDVTFVVVSGINGSAVRIDNLRANVIPEPATFILLGLGGLVLASRRQATTAA